MNHKTDKERLKKIIFTYGKLITYLDIHKISKDFLLNDYTVQWTVTTPLFNIGEQTYQLSKELKDTYPQIPWSKIAGLRHRLVHDYDGTNWDIIVMIIYESLPSYIEKLNEIMINLDEKDISC